MAARRRCPDHAGHDAPELAIITPATARSCPCLHFRIFGSSFAIHNARSSCNLGTAASPSSLTAQAAPSCSIATATPPPSSQRLPTPACAH